MGGGGERGDEPAQRKITKIRAPKFHINRSKNGYFGGGVADGPIFALPVNSSPENLLICGSVCVFVRPFFVVSLFWGVALSPINSKHFELIRL